MSRLPYKESESGSEVVYQFPAGGVPKGPVSVDDYWCEKPAKIEGPQVKGPIKIKQEEVKNKHSHYYKNVKHLEFIDVYKVLSLFSVTDPCLQHAIKKLLVAGGRGAGKDINKDVQEAIDSLKRFQEMQEEEKEENFE